VRRRLFNLAAAVSLVVSAVSVWGAVRSQRQVDAWFYESWTNHPREGRWIVSLVSETGSLEIEHDLELPALAQPHPHPASGKWNYTRAAVPKGKFPFGHFSWMHERMPIGDGSLQIRLIGIPWWSVALMASVLPAWWGLRRGKARRRSKLGECAACGYDLRATTERCPECGTAAAAR
jgi:hypothetical protein